MAEEIKTIIIQGNSYEVADIYEEGHELSAAEASVLNQVRRENLRNNFAGKIKSLPEGADLVAEFEKYRDSYEFGVKSVRAKAEKDPVMAVAKKIATPYLIAWTKGVNKDGTPRPAYKALTAVEKAEKLEAIIAKVPSIMEQAQAQVANANAISGMDLS